MQIICSSDYTLCILYTERETISTTHQPSWSRRQLPPLQAPLEADSCPYYFYTKFESIPEVDNISLVYEYKDMPELVEVFQNLETTINHENTDPTPKC